MINLELYENKIFSQNGEDGITQKLIELIYENNNVDKFYVEFGVQNGIECNIKILREIYNWNGLQMDGDNEDELINLKKEFITKNNVISLFEKYNVPKNINLLSVDIDFNDFYILNEILKYYSSDIIICEYNATHLPNEDKVVIYNEYGSWDLSNYFGASLSSLQNLLNKYNYSLVYCDNRGVNAFFIRNDIINIKNLNFLDINQIDKLYKYPKYGNGPNGGHKSDILNREYISSKDIV